MIHTNCVFVKTNFSGVT